LAWEITGIRYPVLKAGMNGTPSLSGLKGMNSSLGTVGVLRSTNVNWSASGMNTFSRMWPTTSSDRMITGVRNRSERLKALTVWSNISWAVDGQRTMRE
jgi:hypothetical protein